MSGKGEWTPEYCVAGNEDEPCPAGCERECRALNMGTPPWESPYPQIILIEKATGKPVYAKQGEGWMTYVTEAQAKETRCCGPEGCGEIGPDNRRWCIASDCMGWRSYPAMHDVETGDEVEPEVGFCGLAVDPNSLHPPYSKSKDTS